MILPNGNAHIFFIWRYHGTLVYWREFDCLRNLANTPARSQRISWVLITITKWSLPNVYYRDICDRTRQDAHVEIPLHRGLKRGSYKQDQLLLWTNPICSQYSQTITICLKQHRSTIHYLTGKVNNGFS
jgi:hypothetical protein